MPSMVQLPDFLPRNPCSMGNNTLNSQGTYRGVTTTGADKQRRLNTICTKDYGTTTSKSCQKTSTSTNSTCSRTANNTKGNNTVAVDSTRSVPAMALLETSSAACSASGVLHLSEIDHKGNPFACYPSDAHSTIYRFSSYDLFLLCIHSPLLSVCVLCVQHGLWQ